jgi:hypothetical protein
MVTHLLPSPRYGMFAAYADGSMQLFSCYFASLVDVLLTIPPKSKGALITALCMAPSPQLLDDQSESVDPSLLCVARDNGSISIYAPNSAEEPLACLVLSDVPSAKNIRAMVSDGESSLWVGLVGSLLVVDTVTMKRDLIVLKGATAPVVALTMSGNMCFAASRDGVVFTVSIAREQEGCPDTIIAHRLGWRARQCCM